MDTRTMMEIALGGYLLVFSNRISHARSKIISIGLYMICNLVGFYISIQFQFKFLKFAFIMMIIIQVIEIITNWYLKIQQKRELKEERERKEKLRREMDEQEGVVYTLKESEYKEIG